MGVKSYLTVTLVYISLVTRGFPGGSAVKNLPTMQEMRVWFLSQEDPLEEVMATHSGILAWRVPGTAEPGGPQSMGAQRAGHSRVTKRGAAVLTMLGLWLCLLAVCVS